MGIRFSKSLSIKKRENMIFFICIMLVMSSGLMMLYTIGEPMSRQHEEDIKITRWVSVILLIIAVGIGFIFK